jgi:RNA polymerase sigma-70 factor (ECF subfamily)
MPKSTTVLALEGRLHRQSGAAGTRLQGSEEVRGAAAVADTFKGRARVAQPALVNGAAGLVWAVGGQPRGVFGFTIARGKIVACTLRTGGP